MASAHLMRVVQTVEVLEAVVRRAFGPHGGQVLFTRDTGQAMVSRSGTRILTALRLDNPLARMIVEWVSGHSSRTGDGSKSFILLLASLVRTIDRAACWDLSLSHSSGSDLHCSSARRLAYELLSFSLQLDHLITVRVVPYGQRLAWKDMFTVLPSPVQKLLLAFFHTRLSHNNCIFISGLLCELLSNWTAEDPQPYSALQFLNDTWPALYTPVVGFPVGNSRLLEGQIIHRDFAVPSTPTAQGPVKAVVLTEPLGRFMEAGDVLQIGNKGSISPLGSFTERSLECVLSHLQSLGVSVLLSSVKQSAAVLALAAQAQMGVVECIGQEDLVLFSRLSEATPVSTFWNIRPENVVSLAFCKPILLGAHRYVHVGFPAKDHLRPCSLVVCGAGAGQSEQHALAMQDAIKMLLTTWQPPASEQLENPTHVTAKNTSHHQSGLQGCVLTAGGTFEFLLSRALRQNSVNGQSNVVSWILADSLLCIPRYIYSNKPGSFAQIQATIGKFPEHPVDGTIHLKCERSTQDPGLESAFCKYQLLLAVLQCVSQLFRTDAVIHTSSRLKTISNISCEEGGEAEG
ncbi:Bardet-Biedl syndrome 10 protein [Eucyclogobius newberryi]|uniref:Bardet-Biedl syndrome 10 protein n=1 Tax=Eucyclogobius newberryi TaxID=166745 RepID=UPI003B5BA933